VAARRRRREETVNFMMLILVVVVVMMFCEEDSLVEEGNCLAGRSRGFILKTSMSSSLWYARAHAWASNAQ
jgi:hypothetical protein